ncbi:hypothetical protein HDV57DRAFT_494504, partial [Trichoderma longibrachiatum]
MQLSLLCYWNMEHLSFASLSLTLTLAQSLWAAEAAAAAAAAAATSNGEPATRGPFGLPASRKWQPSQQIRCGVSATRAGCIAAARRASIGTSDEALIAN